MDKAIDAAVGAIEIYNKPAFRYREESFAVLMLNAWELLLKARILKENHNRIASIEVWERKTTKAGEPSKKLTPKRNRAGNPMTIGILAAAEVVRQYPKNPIDQRGMENLALLMEIRDNAIHFHNAGRGLQKRVQEIGSAALRNFSFAAREWFGRNLSEYDFALMPFAFESPAGILQTVFADDVKGPTARLRKLLTDATQANPFDPMRPFNVGVEIELRFSRKATDGAITVRVAPGDPQAVPITITEEDARKAFPWTYADLRRALRRRYSDFKESEKFHRIRKAAERDTRYCHTRRLDAKNPRTAKQKFYNPNVLGLFDEHYTPVAVGREIDGSRGCVSLSGNRQTRLVEQG
ncbi:MAG TPA: DUF3644 domain-containing protein [Xanthobacteraceae bacterium]|nr:DUF3644 domain-containing protein [Xanthobacteraceae bacterium]